MKLTPTKKNRFARIDWLYAHKNMWNVAPRMLVMSMTDAGLYSTRTNWTDSAAGLKKTLLPFVKSTSAKEWERIKTMKTSGEIIKKFSLTLDMLRTYRESSGEVFRIGKAQHIYDPAKVERWLDANYKHVPV